MWTVGIAKGAISINGSHCVLIWAEGGDSIGIGSTVSRRDSKGTTAIIPYIFIVIVLKIGTRRVCGSTIATVSSGDSTITGIGITITGGVTER
jgi:hypothetical protein